ncbi:MAG TPA: hypothetical protein DGR97_09255 [Gammaproteobacteria bacterium]|nr:hypothetical protein [Gammaproteobacteria bacterium]|tara:strand:- start:3635 stop:3994 length:360 start_codon:yes stop_codon:yes gene_type:complete
MENNYFEQLNSFSKTTSESAKALETINAKVFAQLNQKNMELFNSGIAINTKLVSLLGNTKDVQTLVTEQTQLTSEYTAKVIGMIRDAADILAGSLDDYQTWLEGTLQSATTLTTSNTTA